MNKIIFKKIYHAFVVIYLFLLWVPLFGNKLFYSCGFVYPYGADTDRIYSLKEMFDARVCTFRFGSGLENIYDTFFRSLFGVGNFYIFVSILSGVLVISSILLIKSRYILPTKPFYRSLDFYLIVVSSVLLVFVLLGYFLILKK